jgi:hypothetical protein
VRHPPQERLPGRRPPPPPSSACLRQRSRSPPGPELSDLVTSGLPREDALDRGERRPGGILPDERSPRRQGRGGLNQVGCGLGIQSPRQRHPRRSGGDEDAKVLAMVSCGSRRRRRAGWGAELVAVAVLRQAQHSGAQPQFGRAATCSIEWTATVMSRVESLRQLATGTLARSGDGLTATAERRCSRLTR